MSTLVDSSPLVGSSTLAGSSLATKLRALGTFDAEVCMNCGICTAACPLKIDVLPRLVMRFGVLGFDEQVRAEKEAVFSCLLCRACEVSCPAGVRITDNIHALRRWLLEEES
jgi:heterodisulfide reductase subunit C